MEKVDLELFNEMSLSQQAEILREWIFTRVKLQSLTPHQAMSIDKIVLENYFKGKTLFPIAYNIGYFTNAVLA